MPRALNLLRTALNYRRDCFTRGLQAAGYKVVDSIRDPQPDDVICCWNRYTGFAEQCDRFEAAGARAIIAENAYLKDLLPGKWFSLALHDHAGLGRWNVGGNERWDDLNIPLAPWRTGGTEVLILEQRGIGSAAVRSPDNWAENTRRRYGGRIRRHPSDGRVAVKPIAEDLENVGCVLTWGSSAALLALAFGIPVFYGLNDWIGAPAARHISKFGHALMVDDQSRLAMFRRLAWAQWRLTEIESGEAFAHLLAR